VTTTRTIRDEVVNVLDYLSIAGIVPYQNQVSVSGNRVSWHSIHTDRPFLVSRQDPSLQDYRNWVEAGAYSALLFDGALLQITYEVSDGKISGHRLAYVPCPYRIDPEMLLRDAVLDVVDLHMETDPTSVVLHSPVRFDYDPDNAAPGHPAAHLTINSSNCRIACAAPLRVGKFVDFIFRNFYAHHWKMHSDYFTRGARQRNVGRTITEEERSDPHIWWN
jgi:hypothetical protein